MSLNGIDFNYANYRAYQDEYGAKNISNNNTSDPIANELNQYNSTYSGDSYESRDSFNTWVNEKIGYETGCTDNKDDGKLSFGDKLKSIGRGCLNLVTNTISQIKENPIKAIGTTLAITAASAAVVSLGIISAPGLAIAGAAVGLGTGVVKVAQGVKSASNAKTDAEAKLAYESIGEGGATAATSALALRKGVKAYKKGLSEARTEASKSAESARQSANEAKDAANSAKQSADNAEKSAEAAKKIAGETKMPSEGQKEITGTQKISSDAQKYSDMVDGLDTKVNGIKNAKVKEKTINYINDTMDDVLAAAEDSSTTANSNGVLNTEKVQATKDFVKKCADEVEGAAKDATNSANEASIAATKAINGSNEAAKAADLASSYADDAMQASNNANGTWSLTKARKFKNNAEVAAQNAAGEMNSAKSAAEIASKAESIASSALQDTIKYNEKALASTFESKMIKYYKENGRSEKFEDWGQDGAQLIKHYQEKLLGKDVQRIVNGIENKINGLEIEGVKINAETMESFSDGTKNTLEFIKDKFPNIQLKDGETVGTTIDKIQYGIRKVVDSKGRISTYHFIGGVSEKTGTVIMTGNDGSIQTIMCDTWERFKVKSPSG